MAVRPFVPFVMTFVKTFATDVTNSWHNSVGFVAYSVVVWLEVGFGFAEVASLATRADAVPGVGSDVALDVVSDAASDAVGPDGVAIDVATGVGGCAADCAAADRSANTSVEASVDQRSSGSGFAAFVQTLGSVVYWAPDSSFGSEPQV